LRARSTPRLPRRFKKPSAETVEMREVGGRTLNSFGAVWATYAAWCERWWVRYQRVRLESFVRVPRRGAARTLAWLRTLVVFSPFAYLESFANVEDMALDADLYLRPGLATWGREKTTSAEASDRTGFARLREGRARQCERGSNPQASLIGRASRPEKYDIQIRNVLCLFACTRFENQVITLFEGVCWRIAREDFYQPRSSAREVAPRRALCGCAPVRRHELTAKLRTPWCSKPSTRRSCR
jgi:hypothetical protein